MLESILAGIISGLFCSFLFYILSGRELVRETSDLRRLSNLLTRALHNADIIKVKFDANGNPTGVITDLQAHSQIILDGKALDGVIMTETDKL